MVGLVSSVHEEPFAQHLENVCTQLVVSGITKSLPGRWNYGRELVNRLSDIARIVVGAGETTTIDMHDLAERADMVRRKLHQLSVNYAYDRHHIIHTIQDSFPTNYDAFLQRHNLTPPVPAFGLKGRKPFELIS